jgi:ABC-type branched-subunit amino acid transport system ATPase component
MEERNLVFREATGGSPAGSEPTLGPVLSARNLTAGYSGLAAIRDVSLEVSPGEIVALLGANGAGKTTTILSLCGELAPMSGEVTFLGEPTRSSLTQRARRGLTLVTEEKSVFMGLTTAENLRLGRGDSERALELFPMLKPHLGRKAGLLSGGQQQILTLGRALASQPKVLLADELTLGLAPIIVSQLLEVLRRVATEQQVGVLLVEQHVRSALSIADRVYVLRRGRVVLSGDGPEMRDRIDEIEKMYLAGSTGDDD